MLGHPGSRARASCFLPFPALQSTLCVADLCFPPTPSFLQTSLTTSASLLCTNILPTYFLIFIPNRLDIFSLNTHLPSKHFPCSGSPSTLHINPLLQTPTYWHPSSSLTHINPHALLANCPPLIHLLTLSPLHTGPPFSHTLCSLSAPRPPAGWCEWEPSVSCRPDISQNTLSQDSQC